MAKTYHTDRQTALAPAPAPAFEPLESRRLASASLFVVNGTDGADTIRVRQSGATVTVTRGGRSYSRIAADVSRVLVNGRGGNDSILADNSVKVPLTFNGDAGRDTLRGGAGGDRLRGGSGDDSISGNGGDDSLFGGAGDDALNGGAGDDVLVSVGGAGDDDLVAGGPGKDVFWADVSSTDRVLDRSSADSVNAIPAFLTYRIARGDGSFSTTRAPLSLDGQDLPDPLPKKGPSGKKDFSSYPLFAASGPTEHDVDQNGASDCYFLATLSTLGRSAPHHIKARVADLGDGTYAVHFQDYDRHTYVRVDGDLPVNADGMPYYAGFGRDRSIWGPIMEKAWAFYRRGQGTYASIELGKAKDVYKALGVTSVQFQDEFRSASSMLNAIDQVLDEGMPLAFWTRAVMPANSPLRGTHVLMAVRVVRNAAGQATHLVLRDPLKTDHPSGRAADGRNDGYLTVTAAQALGAMKGVTWARV